MRNEGKGAHRVVPANGSPTERTLDTYDATTLVGLKTVVLNAAIERKEEDGDTTIEVPMLRELMATAAVARCLFPLRLKGSEIKAIRKIMKMTAGELAKKLDERTAPETISRWESDAQPMGGYAEKVMRLIVCEHLRDEAPGIDYKASMISEMRIIDPGRLGEELIAPELVFGLVKLKQEGHVTDAWDQRLAA